jgi:hypothetical protein
MPRGRKSAESVAITPMLPGAGRPEPPGELSECEARIFRDVVDSLPAHWVDLAGRLILQRVASEAALAEHVEGRIRELLSDDAADAKQIAALTLTHTTLAKSIAFLLGQLRATPKTRMLPRDATAGLAPTRREPGSRPWEITARQ